MPRDAAAPLDNATAEKLAIRLKLIEGYPRDEDVLEASAYQLQRICKGSEFMSATEQATLLVNEAIATAPKWNDNFGWTGMRRLFNTMFRPEEPEYDLKALKPGECVKCGHSGLICVGENFDRCTCERGKLITGEEIERWNQPLLQVNSEPRPAEAKRIPPMRAVVAKKTLTPITSSDVERAARELCARKKRDSDG